jgi:hypothetical protein
MRTVTDHSLKTNGLQAETQDSIVAELQRLREQVGASLKMLQTAAAGEQNFEEEDIGGTLFVLDDVTPRHAAAEAALVACEASLARALEFLLSSDAARRPAASLRLVSRLSE